MDLKVWREKTKVHVRIHAALSDKILGANHMPNGYYMPCVAENDEPYWHYAFGQSPLVKPPAGTIPRGCILYLQGIQHKHGTHQSGWLDGVGRVIVKIGGFRPAPALISNS